MLFANKIMPKQRYYDSFFTPDIKDNTVKLHDQTRVVKPDLGGD